MIFAIASLAVASAIWLLDWLFALLCTPFLLWMASKDGEKRCE